MSALHPSSVVTGGQGQGSVWFVVAVVGVLVLLPVIVGLLWRLRDRRTDDARRRNVDG